MATASQKAAAAQETALRQETAAAARQVAVRQQVADPIQQVVARQAVAPKLETAAQRALESSRGCRYQTQNLTGAVDRIDGAHNEEDAGALVEVSCHIITATWLTSKAFGRHRKEARKVAGFRNLLEEVGTLGASLKKATARVAGVQRIKGARKESVCKWQVPIFTGSALCIIASLDARETETFEDVEKQRQEQLAESMT
ncbi:hypothetical protein HPB52_021874 [Rhipicephalus sanguineus]|uniref:Uncharacterized protein n=1 Tax=Rhipicephalus sanguineus TaxID=34632 RepID=A0A9D4PFU4_RHISA|nr:hypothetical protein HPB52_021874 [Rhipicephalus sanguineus]